MSVNATFTPRREFLKRDRSTSTFVLLSFSGVAFIRLSNFPAALTHTIRKSLEPIRNFRQDTTNNLAEITLQGKPWSQPKSLETERLVVQIFAILLSDGFKHHSSIDYGREADDKMCLVFSKPDSELPGTGSNSSLAPQVPFAVSFPSTTTLRVVSPPLHSTPAILQALRTAWPRGISNEKKIADGSYEFKLKGYSILREDTFPTDSLHHILNILSSLDTHGFSLLASISVTGSHSRVKDLWIFAGIDEGSSHTSIAGPQQITTTPPSIPPILPQSPNSTELASLAAATLPLWDQFSADSSLHQRAATAPDTHYGSNEDITSNADHHRFQSEGAPTGTSSLAARPSVLRKKPPTVEKKEKASDSPLRTNMVLAEELGDQALSTSPDTPARVIYSTPRQVPVAPVASPVAIDSTEPHDIPEQHLMADVLVPIEKDSANLNLQNQGAHPDGLEGVSQTTDKSNDAEHLHQELASSGISNPVVHDEMQSQAEEGLLGSNVFRDTHYTEYSTSNPSSNSVPQVPLPALWSENDGKHRNGTQLSGGSAEVERTSEVTPKQPVLTLPQEEQNTTPPSMERGDTVASMPRFPGGWAPTPAQELSAPLIADTTQYEMTASRTSDYGVIGTVPHVPSATMEVTSSVNKDAEPQLLANDVAPVIESNAANIHKSPEEILAQEESKLPETVEPNGNVDVDDEQALDDVSGLEGLAHTEKSSKPPSAFKRLFNRASRRQSKLQGEAGVNKPLSASQEEKLEKDRRRGTLQSMDG